MQNERLKENRIKIKIMRLNRIPFQPCTKESRFMRL